MVNIDISSEAIPNRSLADFVEIQKVRRAWMWVLLAVAFAGLGMIASRKILLVETTDQLLTLSSVGFIAVLLVMVAVFIYKSQLVTIITSQGISFRFFPLHLRNRFIAWEEVVEVYIREYDALSEYGGWGIKFGSQGNAYTIKGRYGLQMELTDGRKILIGTQRPIELERLILNLLYDYEVH